MAYEADHFFLVVSTNRMLIVPKITEVNTLVTVKANINA